jgi:hypothetical protein
MPRQILCTYDRCFAFVSGIACDTGEEESEAAPGSACETMRLNSARAGRPVTGSWTALVDEVASGNISLNVSSPHPRADLYRMEKRKKLHM